MNAKQIITSNKAILAAALLTLSLTGCALTPATESINYQAQTGVAHVAHAENVTMNVVTTDSRADKVISNKTNMWGMKMAGISADEPVEMIVDRAIEQELKSRGFSINKNSGLTINANVDTFYAKFVQGFAIHTEAKTDITVTVNKDGTPFYAKKIQGLDNTGGIYVISASDATKSLEKALSNAMTELFNDPAFIAALTTAAPAQAATN
jgi:uncharacterized lipoprotein YajG